MRRRPLAPPVLAVLVLALAGCGRDAPTRSPTTGSADRRPAIGVKSEAPEATVDLGFPAFATKNTLRFAGADPVANAAAVSLATFPSQTRGTRPAAVALADAGDWRTAVLASVLAAPPIRAAMLLGQGGELPGATKDALERLAPTGTPAAGGAQVIRVGAKAPRAEGLRTTDLTQADPYALARSVDAFAAAAAERTSDSVLVVSADAPQFAMPAAAWSAKSGDAILFTARDRLPAETRRALAAHRQPRIYVLGPRSVVGDGVLAELRRLGTVRRVGDADPVRNAIAFARFSDSGFGWGVVDPGHGFAFARVDRPADVAGAALLATHGTYAPLVLVRDGRRLDGAVEGYLLDVQPGYTRDPVRGVYNRGLILGDDRALSLAAQARMDALLEIQPVNTSSAQGADRETTQP